MISIGEEFLAGLAQLLEAVFLVCPGILAIIAAALLFWFFYTRVLSVFFGWLIPSQWNWFNGMLRSNWDRFFHKDHAKKSDLEALQAQIEELKAQVKQGTPPP